MIFVDEDTICTGSSDGIIRIVSIAPNNMLGVIGEHGEMPIECLRQSYDRHYMATTSHDSTVKFWNVEYLYETDEDTDVADIGAERKQSERADRMETEMAERKPHSSGFYAGFK